MKEINKATGEQITYSIKVKKSEYVSNFNKPTFEQMLHAFSLMKGQNDILDHMKAGKQIIDLCCTSYDPIFDADNNYMASLCVQLSIDLVVPMSIEVKKK